MALGPASIEPSPSPAFSVMVEAGQELEIPLQGSAWNYLGTNGREGLLFLKRRYEPGRVHFRFRAVVPGEYLLEFSREDVLMDETERRWVSVLVVKKGEGAVSVPGGTGADAPGASVAADPSRNASSAPSAAPSSAWAASPAPSPAAGAARAGAVGASSAGANASAPRIGPAASAGTGIGTGLGTGIGSNARDGGLPDGTAPGTGQTGFNGLDEAGALALLRSELDAKRYASVRDMAKEFVLLYPESEEYLWLVAQAAEAPGPGRDILFAMALYERIVRDFPEGKRRKAAGERAEWIKRSFIEIR